MKSTNKDDDLTPQILGGGALVIVSPGPNIGDVSPCPMAIDANDLK